MRRRAVVLALFYLAIARALGNVYPFSTFEMYGGTRLTSASRIAVVVDGEVHEVERFDRWRCEAPPDPDPRRCTQQWPFFHVEARDREALAHVERAMAPAGEGRDAMLVRRVWRVPEDGAPVIEDCELARCEVAP